jgi:hypothetical protein
VGWGFPVVATPDVQSIGAAAAVQRVVADAASHSVRAAAGGDIGCDRGRGVLAAYRPSMTKRDRAGDHGDRGVELGARNESMATRDLSFTAPR